MEPLRHSTHTTPARETPRLTLVPGLRPVSWWVIGSIVTLAVVLTVGSAYVATRHGSAVTPDSVQYLSAAHHVAHGVGVVTSVTELSVPKAEVPFAAWPPLFPALLGGLMRVGLSPFEAPRYANLVLTAVGVLALAWVAAMAGGRGAVVPVVLAYSLSFYPVLIASFTWSEPLYIALSVISLGLLGVSLRRDSGYPWELALAGVFAGAAMLTRYIGFSLIAATAFSIGILTLHRPFRELARNVLLYLVPAALPNAVWLFRNRLETGFFFGEERPDAWFGWDRILGDTAKSVIRDWAGPISRLDEPWAFALSAGGAFGVLLLAIFAVRRLRFLRFGYPNARTALVYILWIAAVSFVVAMMLLSRQVGFDPINTRYLAPCYPLFLILAVVAFRALAHSDRRRPLAKDERILIGLALVLMALPQVAATAFFASRAGTEERTVSRPYWTSTQWDDPSWDADPGFPRMAQLAGNGVIVSNMWDLIGIRTGLRTKALPEPEWDGYPDRLWDFPGALIAVHRDYRPYRVTVEGLNALIIKHGGLEYLGHEGRWEFFRIHARRGAVS